MHPAAVLVIAGLIGVTVLAAHPLRWPEAALRARLFWSVPLGTPMADVKRFIERNGWTIDTYSEDRGFYDQRVRPAVMTGAKHIQASLGDYTAFALIMPLRANVTVFWGFDESSRLVDLWVWRNIEGL
jgi:hypothetical protein